MLGVSSQSIYVFCVFRIYGVFQSNQTMIQYSTSKLMGIPRATSSSDSFLRIIQDQVSSNFRASENNDHLNCQDASRMRRDNVTALDHATSDVRWVLFYF